MQALGVNVTKFLIIVSLYFLCLSCVRLVFGEDENFDARLNPKFSFIGI